MAYQTSFDFSGNDEAYVDILPFYKEKIAEMQAFDERFGSQEAKALRSIFGIDTFDLNDDGKDEIFVWLSTSYYCGTNRCDLQIFSPDQQGNLRVIEATFPHGGPAILRAKTNGWHDLAYYEWGYGKEFLNIMKWDGVAYQFSHSVSTSAPLYREWEKLELQHL